jgi:hypothetical protein
MHSFSKWSSSFKLYIFHILARATCPAYLRMS